MDWAKLKLPIPIYQQEKGENCLSFLNRIQISLQSNNLMDKEEAIFWFLIGVRDDIIPKIPFDPAVSQWIDPDELEKQLEDIDNGERLNGPFRINRFQNCFNYFVCFKCGYWGHKSVKCRNAKPPPAIGRMLKRKIWNLYFEDEEHPPKKRHGNPAIPMDSPRPVPLFSVNYFEGSENETWKNNHGNHGRYFEDGRTSAASEYNEL